MSNDGLPCVCRFRSVEGAIKQGRETGVLVDPDEPIQECDLHKALRERVEELKGELREWEGMEEYADELLGQKVHWKNRAETAEALIVEREQA